MAGADRPLWAGSFEVLDYTGAKDSCWAQAILGGSRDLVTRVISKVAIGIFAYNPN